MRLSNKNGFTIIETMLFLGVTGLLVMGVLVGTGASINIQRYRDSITSLQSLLQQQFSDVASVSNGRSSDWDCDSNGTVVEKLGSNISRGQSECVMLGRLITTTNTSQSILIRDIIGYAPSSVTPAQNDIDALSQYNMQVSPVTKSSYNIEWNSSMIKPKPSNEPAEFSILILQSPISGIVRAFIDNDEVVQNDKIKSLIKLESLQESASVKICINPNGLFDGKKMAVTVTAGASSASGVETLGENSGC